MTTDPSPTGSDSVEVMLRSKLDAAEQRVDALEREYADVLGDPGVIQEDRDATAVLLEEAKRARNAARDGLERFLEGSYGRCVRCGAVISAERLEAIPDATTCTSCM
jgi:DnaK suppressor protein